MSDFDERKILRRLNEIAQIKPADDATQRALDKVRQQMADDTGVDEESDSGAGRRRFTIKRAVVAVAAVVVVAMVITAGLMLKTGYERRTDETVKTVLTDKTVKKKSARKVTSARPQVETEAFLEMIEDVFAAGDVSEAVTLITQASDEQRDAAMTLLARLMKEQAARQAAADEITDELTETLDESITGEEDLDVDLTSDTTTAPKDDTTIIKEGTGVFSGIVIDENSKPVAGATVNVKGKRYRDRDKPDGLAITDKDGIFTVHIQPDKMPLDMPVAIWAYVKGDEKYMAWTLLDNEGRKKNVRKNLAGGRIPGDPGEIKFDRSARRYEGASSIVLEMEKAGRIFGTVRDSLGQPVEGAKVWIFFRLDVEGEVKYRTEDLWDYITITDKDGGYKVGNLPALWDQTGWRLKISADAHIAKFENFRSDGPLDEKQVDIELLLTGIAVRGVVVDNYGNPLANRNISISPDHSYGEVVPSYSRTNADGEFRVEDCAIVEKLIVEADLSYNRYTGGSKEDKSFVYYPDATAEIFIEEDQFEYDVELIATLPEITIEVEVIDPNNNPLAYFPVMVTGADISGQWRTDENFTQRTDEDGQCLFTNVPETTGLKLIFAGDTAIRTDELNAEQRQAAEELTLLYRTAEQVEVSIIVVPSQKNYKVQARIPLRLNQVSPLGAEQAP